MNLKVQEGRICWRFSAKQKEFFWVAEYLILKLQEEEWLDRFLCIFILNPNKCFKKYTQFTMMKTSTMNISS
jgi:hypothetical protein